MWFGEGERAREYTYISLCVCYHINTFFEEIVLNAFYSSEQGGDEGGDPPGACLYVGAKSGQLPEELLTAEARSTIFKI